MLITESIICNLWHQDRPLLPLCCQTPGTVPTGLLLLLLLWGQGIARFLIYTLSLIGVLNLHTSGDFTVFWNSEHKLKRIVGLIFHCYSCVLKKLLINWPGQILA